MLQERRSKIIQKIQQTNVVKVSDLMEEFGVSIETIRRDLEYLEEKNYLKRVYGGAVKKGFNTQEPTYKRREVEKEDEKKKIAAAAAELVSDGDTLFMDVGTTVLETARQLGSKKRITVITNSTLTAQALIEVNPENRVILLGGELRNGDLSVSGYLCGNSLENFYADKAIIGAGGITIESGITDYHLAEANTRRLMIRHSDQVIIVADSSKFGVIAMNRVCPVSDIHTIVVDDSLPEKEAQRYRDKGLRICFAR